MYYRLLLIITSMIACIAGQSLSSGFIVSGGKSLYKTVIPANPEPAQIKASQEIIEGIQKMTGVKMIQAKTGMKPNGPSLFIGRNEFMPADLKQLAGKKLAEEEILIAPGKDGSVLVCGGSPRGTLYAAYEFLYRLGVRFYTPQYTKYPKLRRIPVPSYYRYNPPLRGRSILVGNGADVAWNARNRMNSVCLWGNLPAEYGYGRPEGPDMHTFWRFVQPGVLNEHPDWCAEVKGQRLPPSGNNNWGLCLKPEVRSYLVDRAVEWANNHPDIKIVWMGENDGSPYCTCDYCSSFYRKHGGKPSSLVAQLCNELAEKLPDRSVKMLAYGWTQAPPQNMRMRDNVIIMFCATTGCHIPIRTNPADAKLRAYLAGWTKIARNISTYLYAYPNENYWFPSPSLYPGTDNIKWAAKSGINEVYAQISGFGGSYGSESMDLRAWVFTRMMWNPGADPKALVKEFCRDYYGSAGPDIEKVFNSLRYRPNENKGKPGELSIVPDYVDMASVSKANRLLENAYRKLPANDGDLRSRFEFFWIPYLWADVWSGFKSLGCYDSASKTWAVPMDDGNTRNRYAVLVKSLMVKHGVNSLSELMHIDPNKLCIDKFGKKWPAVKLSEDTLSLVVVPGISGNIFELKDTRSNLKPLKEAWYFAILQYPLFAGWSEQVDGQYLPDYIITGSGNGWVEMQTKTGPINITKRVSVKNSQAQVVVGASGSSRVNSAIMLDMNDSAFGTNPLIRVEKQDGSWNSMYPAEGLGDFWYCYKGIDLTGATGRLQILDSRGQKGMMYIVDPAKVDSMAVEYDSYKYPAGLGRMFRLLTTSKPGIPLDISISVLQ